MSRFDPRHSTLKRIVHVVCSPKPDYVAVITAYIPNEDEWEEDFEQRKKEVR